jgi:acetyl-CoA carboxylase biotin carboxylase subunit
MFKKILIANRGEIAVRVARACREMGIASVAVYSDADRAALHVVRADEAYRIGPPPAAESYLNIDRILEAAKASGADAIHPGYGFLSENPRFARACGDAGIKFIGPPAGAMEIMGSKTRARQQMEKAGVPLVPGTSSGVADLHGAQTVARKIGYPVMLKAAAGGGGKGMRLVSDEQELASALQTARGEALRAFGDDEVYVEKAIVNPRHIEMQVLADEHGNCVYLGERECSIQRRHQKVLEEAPAPAGTPEMRSRMGEVAVKAAMAAGYANAGTIEFLVDSEGNFYFLEMNTRLQVEHPVTELVTGMDLVQLQVRIAAGEKLPFSKGDISLRGHAIECRVYAEDPENNFFPSAGKITALSEPAGPGIRIDSGIYEGWAVPMDYDPLLAKLIGYGQTREQAIGRLRRALQEYFIAGVKTNLSLFRDILTEADFVSGKTDTGYLGRLAAIAGPRDAAGSLEAAAIAAGIFVAIEPTASADSQPVSADSTWRKTARSEALS